ncbi:hypothetical protein BpHYR1_035206 [Brachionus plicatilis]|uniref:Uncharacterized protein n=1 Tax=Brachionus plicatilis TaxID=10195 RepID=A0A3M7T946_BRAPC|nr:hypothetical protein BpHYR1_035206 [Brachionus plicatilis]
MEDEEDEHDEPLLLPASLDMSRSVFRLLDAWPLFSDGDLEQKILGYFKIDIKNKKKQEEMNASVCQYCRQIVGITLVPSGHKNKKLHLYRNSDREFFCFVF